MGVVLIARHVDGDRIVRTCTIWKKQLIPEYTVKGSTLSETSGTLMLAINMHMDFC